MDISALNSKVDLSPGEWVDDIPNQPGLRLRVRSVNYKPYRVATAGVTRRSNKLLKTDEGVVDYMTDLGKPQAEHILIDWDLKNCKGSAFLTSGGEPLAYSKETALTVLTMDDDFGVGADFRAAVEWAATDVADRLAKQAQDVAGN